MPTNHGSDAGSKARDAAKARQRKLEQAIADTARQLVDLVHERAGNEHWHIAHRVIVDPSWVSLTFLDEPDGLWDIVKWRQ